MHSGEFGGVVPDALTAFCRLLATLHDDVGDVAVAGLQHRCRAALDYPEERLREESGLLPGVDWIGTGPFVDRIWTKPSLTVIAIDATPVDRASNTLVPSARAKISMRLAPGDDARTALDQLADHLVITRPGTRVVEVTAGTPASRR